MYCGNNTKNIRDMQDEILIKHCSPTLAGLKTANLLNLKYADEQKLFAELRKFNSNYAVKGMRAICLKYSNQKALIYIYRPDKLKKDLQQAETENLLQSFGYFSKNPSLCLRRLAARCDKTEEFPHEIGLFLGYPPQDVKCFIDEKCGGCSNCKFCGVWKVYTDEESARKTFAMYKKCRKIYYEQWRKGKSIDRLIVGM